MVPSKRWTPTERLALIKKLAGRVEELPTSHNRSFFHTGPASDFASAINAIASESSEFLERHKKTILKMAR